MFKNETKVLYQKLEENLRRPISFIELVPELSPESEKSTYKNTQNLCHFEDISSRKNFAKTIDRVYEDRQTIIRRENDKPMMLISLEDYNAIEETAYLLRSPANAERLRASIKQYEQGKTVKKNLLES